jgi:uncharacterized membrane protein
VSSRASITVLRPRQEVEGLWQDSRYRSDVDLSSASVRFVEAPGDRGTEIHLELAAGPAGGKLGEAAAKLLGTEPVARMKDELRRFKQRVETGDIPRSEALPEGELLQHKFRQRPAQPLRQDELQKVGV